MDSFYENPPSHNAVLKKLCSLKREFDFLRVSSIGRSVQGRKIHAVFLGNICRPVLFAGAFHAQEWLTGLLLLRFCEEICGEYKKRGELYSSLCQRGVIILPFVNPDGVELVLTEGRSAGRYRDFVFALGGGDFSTWQANIRGVDLNHNFDAGHDTLIKMERAQGIYSPSPRQYGGLFPHSECESRAIVNLARRYSVGRVYAFHSQGEEIFYRYGKNTPTGSEAMAKILSEACGYSLPTQTSLASHGGFKDWFIEKTGRPGFTIEIGRGKNPLPIDELNPIFARLYETMVLALVI